MVTPGSAPGVSDDVVLFASFASVSDGGDGVIEVSSAFLRIDDSFLVHMEHWVIGFNGDGDDGLVNGSLELGDAVASDVGVGSHADLAFGLHILARARLSGCTRGVRVVTGQLLLVRLEVFEGR